MKILFYSKELSRRKDDFIAWLPEHEVRVADEDTVFERIADADVLITRPGVGSVMSRDALESAPKLKLWHQWGAGLEGLDFEFCAARGIAVCNTPSRGTGNAEGVTEIAILHMLLLGRKYAFACENMAKGKMFSPAGISLWRADVCVVGLGNLGRTLAERLSAMGARVCGVNRTSLPPDTLEEFGIKEFFSLKDLNKAVAGRRFVVAALAFSDETKEIFNDSFFDAMADNAFFINVARGGLVDEAALLRALDSGHLAGAGLDVFAQEPPARGNPLLTHKNVTLTPHIGGITSAAQQAIFDFIHDNITRLAKGEPLAAQRHGV
ncbi:hypothetical protein FACS1894187_08540 [Synergistales bacterium]|nr:hypothetical protein FACS1894187_08540 [Synergistales bacterium]